MTTANANIANMRWPAGGSPTGAGNIRTNARAASASAKPQENLYCLEAVVRVGGEGVTVKAVMP